MAYVYRHIRLDKNEPFYIGIGSDSEGKYKRAFQSRSRNNYWKSILNVTDHEVEIILDDLTWEEACQKEIEFILLYGRKDLGEGILCNMTNGGDGSLNAIVSKSTREKMSASQKQRKDIKNGNEHHWFGKKHSEETKQKMSEKSKGHKRNTGRKNLSLSKKLLLSGNPSAKKTINTLTKEIFGSGKEAWIDYCNNGWDKSYVYFKEKLNGTKKNNTNYAYLEDYNNINN